MFVCFYSLLLHKLAQGKCCSLCVLSVPRSILEQNVHFVFAGGPFFFFCAIYLKRGCGALALFRVFSSLSAS